MSEVLAQSEDVDSDEELRLLFEDLRKQLENDFREQQQAFRQQLEEHTRIAIDQEFDARFSDMRLHLEQGIMLRFQNYEAGFRDAALKIADEKLATFIATRALLMQEDVKTHTDQRLNECQDALS